MEGHTGIGDVAAESGEADQIVGSSNNSDVVPTGYRKREGGLEEKLLNQAQKIGLDKSQIVVQRIEGGVRIQIIDADKKPMFESGSTEPTEKCREILAAIAADIMNTNERISVEGHTDSAPTRGAYTNWDLSLGRANSAVRELEKARIDMSRMESVVGYADTMPYNRDDPYDSTNRRISITLLQPKKENSEQLPKSVKVASKGISNQEKRFPIKTKLFSD